MHRTLASLLLALMSTQLVSGAIAQSYPLQKSRPLENCEVPFLVSACWAVSASPLASTSPTGSASDTRALFIPIRKPTSKALAPAAGILPSDRVYWRPPTRRMSRLISGVVGRAIEQAGLHRGVRVAPE